MEHSNRDSILREFKKKSQVGQQQAKRQTQLAEKLQNALNNLETLSQEIDKVIADYKQAHENIQTETKDIRKYFDKKSAGITAQLPDSVGKNIETVRNEVARELEWMENEIKKLEGKNNVKLENGSTESVQFAVIQSQNAESGPDGRDAKQKSYDELKNKQNVIRENLEKLKGLKNSIVEEEKKGNTPNMYFLILDLGNLLEKTEKSIEDNSPDTLNEKLDTVWNELKSTREKLIEAEVELSISESKLTTTKENLEEARKGRHQRILEAIKNIKAQLPIGVESAGAASA